MTYPGQYPPPSQGSSAPAYAPAPVQKESGNGVLLWLAIGSGVTVLLAIAAVIALIVVLPSAKIPSFDPFEGMDEGSYAGESDQTEPPESCEGLCFSESDVRTLMLEDRSLALVDGIEQEEDYLIWSESAGYYFDEQNDFWTGFDVQEVDCSFIATWTPVWLESASSAGVRDQRVIELGFFGDDAQSISETGRAFDTVEQAENFMATLSSAIHDCPTYSIPGEGSVTTYTVTELTPETTPGVAATGWIDSGYPSYTNVLHQYGNVVVMSVANIGEEGRDFTIDEADLDLFYADEARRLGSLSIYD